MGAASFMKDPLAHEDKELAAVLAFQVVPGVAREFVFMRITQLTVTELCDALSAHLGSIKDFVFAFASAFVCCTFTGVSEDPPAFPASFGVFLRYSMSVWDRPSVAVRPSEVSTVFFGQLARKYLRCLLDRRVRLPIAR